MALFDLLGARGSGLTAPTALGISLVTIVAKALRVEACLLFQLHPHVLIRVLKLDELSDLRC